MGVLVDAALEHLADRDHVAPRAARVEAADEVGEELSITGTPWTRWWSISANFSSWLFFVANSRETSSWPAESMLMQKRSDSRTAASARAQVEQTSASGLEREELSALAVAPAGPSSPCAVITLTVAQASSGTEVDGSIARSRSAGPARRCRQDAGTRLSGARSRRAAEIDGRRRDDVGGSPTPLSASGSGSSISSATSGGMSSAVGIR